MEKIIKVDKAERVDIFLSEKLNNFTRTHIQRLIKSGNITVNGRRIKPSFRLEIDDEIQIRNAELKELKLKKENKPLKILYEDKYLLVVDKEAGVIVHPVGNKNENTLVNRLLFHVEDLSGIGGVRRPGIVHRLDKDTSGLLIVAKNDEAHVKLSEMFKIHSVDRRYIVLIKGKFKQHIGKIDLPLSRKIGETKMCVAPFGRRAITHFKVIEEIGPFSLVAVKLETGRTHQIRVHFSYLGHPVVGDVLYGGKLKEIPLKRQFMHAYEISFNHPIINDRITVYSMLPDELRKILDLVRRKWKKR